MNENHDAQGRFSSGGNGDASHLAVHRELHAQTVGQPLREATQRLLARQARQEHLYGSTALSNLTRQHAERTMSRADFETAYGYQGKTGARSVSRTAGDD